MAKGKCLVCIRRVVVTNVILKYSNNPWTSLDMDGTLTLIFAESETTRDFITKFTTLKQLSEK